MSPDLADRVRGVLFGQAVGDALGFGAEFLSRAEADRAYPDGLRSYAQIRRFQPNQQWRPGDWTDDTEQMLCILDSLLACGGLDLGDVACRLRRWVEDDGFGMGSTVYAVVRHPDFLRRPQQVAAEFWEASGRTVASNGGVMRTAILGVWDHADEGRVRRNAEDVCRLTHADPRCVGSCVAVCLAVRRLLLGADDVAEVADAAAAAVRSYHPEMERYFELAREDSLAPLDLDEGRNPGEENRLGYTLKTLGAAFWALRHAATFAEGITAVIDEAGDADTNAAVAGALLGARFGVQGIDQAWLDGLIHRAELERRAGQLIERCH
jgi:ADP-ribosylglycohydrolase